MPQHGLEWWKSFHCAIRVDKLFSAVSFRSLWLGGRGREELQY